jgi:hypothetical protein
MAHKDNWLANSKQTHGDGNLSKQAPIKGKQSMSPIQRFGDGVKAQAAPKGKRGDAPIANFAGKGAK